jgi:hypothetical protein
MQFNYILYVGLLRESRHKACSDPEGNVVKDEALCDPTQGPDLVRDCEDQTDDVKNNFLFKINVDNSMKS